jgi:transcriptional regulator with XRE-family HTH domain
MGAPNKNRQKELKKLGEHLKHLRELRGMSLRDVSYGCTVDYSKLSKIENGNINIAFTTLLELAKAFEITPSQLLDFPTE